jgi:hypothetical protein
MAVFAEIKRVMTYGMAFLRSVFPNDRHFSTLDYNLRLLLHAIELL